MKSALLDLIGFHLMGGVWIRENVFIQMLANTLEPFKVVDIFDISTKHTTFEQFWLN